jgi:hypothetical protein
VEILSFNQFNKSSLVFEATNPLVSAAQAALKTKGYANLLGTSGPNKDGVDGTMGPNTTAAVKKFQADNGLKADGIIGPNTAAKLGVQPLVGTSTAGTAPIQYTGQQRATPTTGVTPTVATKPGTKAEPAKEPVKKPSTQTVSGKASIPTASKQVNAQINYLKSVGYAKPFTIVDDKNAKVYAINSDYTLNREYQVITGRDKGDELKKMTFTDWFTNDFTKNLVNLASTWWKTDLDTAANQLDNCYFGNEIFKVHNTPAGVFRRREGVGAWLTDKIAIAFAEKDYGKRYISWETLDGKEVPYGFHGTRNPQRIDVAKDAFTKQACEKGRKMSFGCINFKDADVTTIDKFVTPNQLSFWLPDATNDIVKLPQSEIVGSPEDRYNQFKAENPKVLDAGKI